ncbi:MAG: hypothetical protein AAFN77_07705 [Planctomycetota bacterium]
MNNVQEEEAEQEEDEASEEQDDEPLEQPKVKKDVDPQMMQVQLWDGTKITGRVDVKTIRIVTEFGDLNVPIKRIKKIYPGYQSYPEIRVEIDSLVEALGDKDFDNREAAQRKLLDKGLMFQSFLMDIQDHGELSAEQKKRMTEILKELEAYREELAEEFDELPDRDLIEGDLIETGTFSIVGKIDLDKINFETRFGMLSVSLSDIKAGDRTAFQTAEIINRNFTVKGEAFFQRKPVSTRIRVKKGDRVTIRGSGTVNWTNWSTVSSPTGLPNQGQHQGIPCGALCARIGSGGKILLVGDKKTFVASSSGTLYLGVAMMDNYVNESSYRWTGSFKARVKVTPKGQD